MGAPVRQRVVGSKTVADTHSQQPNYWIAILGFLSLMVVAALSIALRHLVLGFTVALASLVVLAMSNPETGEE